MSLDDYAEISFVEVVVHFFEPGDKTRKDFFLDGNLEIFDLNLEDYAQDIQEVVRGKIQTRKNEEETIASGKNWWTVVTNEWEEDLLVTQPFQAFQFRMFGQAFDPTFSSGIDHEVYSMGKDETFKDWQEDLVKIARELQEKFNIRKDLRTDWDGKVVRFVTLWSYMGWSDSYTKEFESEWELLGLVTPSKKLLEVE